MLEYAYQDSFRSRKTGKVIFILAYLIFMTMKIELEKKILDLKSLIYFDIFYPLDIKTHLEKAQVHGFFKLNINFINSSIYHH